MSNYPPGVTGSEWQITGEDPDMEEELEAPRSLQSLLVLGSPKKRHTIPYAMEKRDGSHRCPKCKKAVMSNGRGGWKHAPLS